MRIILKNERLKKELTQKELAKQLNISERYYQAIELGEQQGSIAVWDKLEDIFNIPQRQLRKLNKSSE